ncbi:transcriptional regulator family: Fungal Specific TF [Penicillium sp. IBT 31633x]|nr:transcriptional regulator family: Fungal Specific TF [Penicillium sp. IBT 31633x]
MLSHNPSLLFNPGRERRAFEYYAQHAAHYLSGGLGVDFWTQVVPQICRSEPAVWDAMIAISALFEYPDQCLDFHFLRSRDCKEHLMNQSQRDGLAWYSRSISTVRSQIQRGRADPYISLISCVLFICIETIQGRVEEALQLYRQGVQLILDLRVQITVGGVSTSKAALLEHTIVPLFLRLGGVSLTVSGTQPSELYLTTEKAVSSTFSSIDSARAAIVLLSAEAMIFERESTLHLEAVGGDDYVSSEMLQRKKSLQDRLYIWHNAYTDLCEKLRAAATSIATEPILLAYHASASIIATGCLTHLQNVYDVHTADFMLIVEQASQSLNASKGPDGSQPPFTFEMGTGIPLTVTVMKCRDSILRRKALSLLKQAPSMQGFFKCTPVALLAENLMKLEESFSLALGEKAANRKLPSSPLDIINPAGLSSSKQEATGIYPAFVPEEARICGYGVFKPGNGLPAGIKKEDITRWGLDSDRLFLQVTRNRLDAATVTWEAYSECMPLGCL